MNWILAIVLAITATKEYVDRQDGALEAEIATNTVDIAALEAGKQDVISDLETIRAGAALGATALQSYTETDPTVPSWAKALSKPSYAYSEISGTPTTWAWSALTGLPTTLAGYGITDALSRTTTTMTSPGVYTEYLLNGSLQGGVRMRYSSTSEANQTTYMYSGVAARRNGTTTDYLWDTTSESGIVRRSELEAALAAKYEKPSTGIPKTDLSEGVQASLDKADTALQTAPVTSVNGKTGAVSLTASDVGAVPTAGGVISGNLRFQNGDYFLALYPNDVFGQSGPIILLSDGQGNSLYITPTGIRRGRDTFIEFPSVAGTLALLSDIPTVPTKVSSFTNDAGYLTEHQSLANYYTKAEVDTAIAGAAGGGVKAVSVESGGTFGTGDLADGKVEMWRVTTAGAYTPSSSWHLIGYGAWPAAGSTFQCTVWRIGSSYYCNIIVVE